MRTSRWPFLTRVLSSTPHATTYPATLGAMTTTLPSVYASSVVTRLRRANQTMNAATAATATTMPRMIRGFLLRGPADLRSPSPSWPLSLFLLLAAFWPSFPFDSARPSSALRESPSCSDIPTSGVNALESVPGPPQSTDCVPKISHLPIRAPSRADILLVGNGLHRWGDVSANAACVGSPPGARPWKDGRCQRNCSRQITTRTAMHARP